MDWADLASKLLVGLITGLSVAYFTASYALSRFYKEKWWDKRANLYIQLVEAIYAIKKAALYWDGEQLSLRSGHSEHIVSLSKEEKDALTIEHDKATNELRKISDLSPLLLNDECKRLIDDYLEKQDNLLNQWNYDEIELDDATSKSLKSVDELLTSIITEAKRELRPDQKNLKEKIKCIIAWLENNKPF